MTSRSPAVTPHANASTAAASPLPGGAGLNSPATDAGATLSPKLLVRDTILYGLSGAISKLLAVFTVPILTRFLSPTDYGVIDAAVVWATVFAGVIVLGQDSAIARFLYDRHCDPNRRVRVVASGLVIQLALLALFALVFWCFSDSIGRLLFGEHPELIRYWKLALLIVPGSVLSLFAANLFKWNFQRGPYLLLTLGSSMLQVGLTVFMVAYLRWGIYGGILPAVISMNFFSLIGLYVSLKSLRVGRWFPTTELIKEMALYGLPFTVAMLASALIPSVDRLFLVRYSSLSEMGIYAVATKVSSLMGLVVGAFSIAFGPYAFSVWDRDEARRLFGELCAWLVILLVFLSLLISAVGGLLLHIAATKDYSIAVLLLPPLTLSYVFQGMLEFTLLGIAWGKKPIYNLVVVLSGLASMLAFNYALVPSMTTMGAALAFLVSKALMNLVAYVFSSRYYHIDFGLRRIFGVLAVALGALGLVYLDFYAHSIATLFLKFFAVFSFPLFGFLIVFPPERRREFLSHLASFLRESRWPFWLKAGV